MGLTYLISNLLFFALTDSDDTCVFFSHGHDDGLPLAPAGQVGLAFALSMAPSCIRSTKQAKNPQPFKKFNKNET